MQPEELEHAVVNRLWLGKEVAAVDDVDPVSADHPLQPIELLRVSPSSQVGVVLVAEAEVVRILPDAVLLAAQPLIFELERPLERLALEAPRKFVRVRGVSPLNRVADQHD